MFNELIKMLKDLEIGIAIIDTLLMVSISTVIAYVIGLPLGVIAICTSKDNLFYRPVINKILNVIINLGRSIPFLIMLVALIPISKAIMGTSIGVRGMIVPLSIGAIPFVTRLVEVNLQEVDSGLIDAAKTMGCNNFQIIRKVYLREATPSIIRGLSITMIMLVGYSAMAGAVGGGGLGALAIEKGYYLFNTKVMLIILIVLIILVQILYLIFELLANIFDKNKK